MRRAKQSGPDSEGLECTSACPDGEQTPSGTVRSRYSMAVIREYLMPFGRRN
jgi:hypothetical protein